MPKLSKETFMEQMNQLLVFFPNWQVDLGSKTVAERWYHQFAACSDREFCHMVQTYIQQEPFHPTVAGLHKYFVSVQVKRMEQLQWEQTFQKQQQALEKERQAHVRTS